jgi:hypothetical protein
MRNSTCYWLVVLAMFAIWPRDVWAGMPSSVRVLSELARMRLDVISFFLAGLFGSAAVVRWIWNSLRQDFPKLPQLSLRGAMGVVMLWGLLFILVLTMISGARELMTPDAWEPNGLTYRLTRQRPTSLQPQPSIEVSKERREKFDRLRIALWEYAVKHDGQFPTEDARHEISAEAWELPNLVGLRYLYIPELKADAGDGIIAYEPGVYGPNRLVLLANGDIRQMSLPDIRQCLERSRQ